MGNLKKVLSEKINLQKKLIKNEKIINKIINLFVKTLNNNNTIYICGNGGSASDAEHLSTEFLVRLRPKVNRKPFPVITLAQDTSTITACGNDCSKMRGLLISITCGNHCSKLRGSLIF